MPHRTSTSALKAAFDAASGNKRGYVKKSLSSEEGEEIDGESKKIKFTETAWNVLYLAQGIQSMGNVNPDFVKNPADCIDLSEIQSIKDAFSWKKMLANIVTDKLLSE